MMRPAIIVLLLFCVTCAPTTKIVVPITPPSQLCPETTGICVPSARLAQMFEESDFDIVAWRGVGQGVSGSLMMWLSFPAEHVVVRTKWKQAPRNGSGFDNDPRKEIAAYRLQQLFLDPDEYVVPPTVARCIPHRVYHQRVHRAHPTFDHTRCVFGVLAYWLEGVRELPAIDQKRFEGDRGYRAAIANLNLFTYLFDHRDTRPSNFVITADHDAPRAFAIDNGLALSGITNPRTTFLHEWRQLLVHKLPHAKIDRLRKLTREDLDVLGTVAEFRIVDGGLEAVAPLAPLDPNQGVRVKGDIVQLGLTRGEIDGVASRLKALLARIDAGQLEEY
jgi:hypothetical protein